MRSLLNLTVFNGSALECLSPEPVLYVPNAALAPGCPDHVFLAWLRLVAHNPIAITVLVVWPVKIMVHAELKLEMYC